MKKIFLFLFLMFSFVSANAGEIKKLIFFGDSLTDNGNLYSLTFHLVPPSPPYFKGRFTNGPTWAESVGDYYHSKFNTDYKIYAYGGATALFHMPTPTHLSTSLSLEIDKYLLDSLFRDKSHVLFSIWIGGNDYLFYRDQDIDKATTTVVNQISSSINTLITNGGKNFLILNLPDLGSIPKVRGTPAEAYLHAVSVLHNQKLDAAIENLKNKYPDVNFTQFSIYDTITDVLADPEKYNKKYNVHVTHIYESCWTGGFFSDKKYLENNLKRQIQQTLAGNVEDINTQALSDFIMQNPELADSLQMGLAYQQGNVPCANPDEYFFWDSVHPTVVAHNILSQMIVESLGNRIG